MRRALPAAPASSRTILGDEGGRVIFGEEGEGVGEKRIAGEERGGFVEFLMCGGAPAAEVIVVHAGQVVVDQRVGVHALDGDGGGQGVGLLPEELGGGEHQHGAEALAAGLHGITHGFMDAAQAGVIRGGDGWQEAIDAGFNAGDMGV